MIKAVNLNFSYSGSAPYILKGLNLDLNKGEYVSVVGDNGSGKKHADQIDTEAPEADERQYRNLFKRIGYVPQKNDAQHAGFPITVSEMLDSYRHLLKIRDKGIIAQSLYQVGLSDYSSALMGTLSGGQSQKILIARALMGNPDLLILDEPSTGVDTGSQKEIYGIIKKLNVEHGITIVSVEHNLVAAISNSTLIYHLDSGHGHICTPAQFSAELTGLNNRKEG